MSGSRLCTMIAVTTLFSFTNYSFAETLNGIWSSEYGCNWLEQNANNKKVAVDDDSAIYSIGYLDSTGVNGVNWGCAFTQMSYDSSGKLHADSNCWMETDFWKQNITISKIENNWIVVMKEDLNEKVYLVFDTQCVATP